MLPPLVPRLIGLPGVVHVNEILPMMTRLPRLIGLLRGVQGGVVREVGPGEDTLVLWLRKYALCMMTNTMNSSTMT